MKAIKNVYLRKMIDEKKLVISYLYDEFGFRYGAIVAVPGKDFEGYTVGMSVVHKDDYEIHVGAFTQIPAVQTILKGIRAEGDSKDYADGLVRGMVWSGKTDVANDMLAVVEKLFTKRQAYVLRPKFDREEALKKAIKDAKTQNIVNSWQSRDAHFQFVLDGVHARAQKLFCKDEL